MAAGTIPLSMTQQFNEYGDPLAGGQLYIIQAGTVSTPQDAFQDTALTVKMPYPMVLDAAGRVPQFFVDNAVNATVKIRLQDKTGVVQLSSDGVLIIGPAGGSGGSGGLTGDTTQLIKTGMMMFSHTKGSDQIAGFVRLNGLTIGSSTSSATMPEGRGIHARDLFLFLWLDPSLAVTPLPRTTASDDWDANKQIAVPDWRGYELAAVDGMGNTDSGRLEGYFTNPTTLGSAGGTPKIVLTAANIPSISSSGTSQAGAVTVTSAHWIATNTSTSTGQSTALAGGSGGLSVALTGGQIEKAQSTGTPGIGSASVTSTGTSGNGFSIITPRKHVTFFMKL